MLLTGEFLLISTDNSNLLGTYKTPDAVTHTKSLNPQQPGEFPGGPVIRTRVFTTVDLGSIPGPGPKIPQAVWCDQKTKTSAALHGKHSQPHFREGEPGAQEKSPTFLRAHHALVLF